MYDFLKKIKTNAFITAVLYAALGLVLLIWPALSTNVLCTALGLVLVLCGVVDMFVFLGNRDGSLYAGFHLVLGIILTSGGCVAYGAAHSGAVILPRIIRGAHLYPRSQRPGQRRDAAEKTGYSRWTNTCWFLGL